MSSSITEMNKFLNVEKHLVKSLSASLSHLKQYSECNEIIETLNNLENTR